jgi:hypothetical protein
MNPPGLTPQTHPQPRLALRNAPPITRSETFSFNTIPERSRSPIEKGGLLSYLNNDDHAPRRRSRPGLTQNRLVNGDRSMDEDVDVNMPPILEHVQRPYTTERTFAPKTQRFDTWDSTARSMRDSSPTGPPRAQRHSRVHPPILLESSRGEEPEPFDYTEYFDPFRDYDPLTDIILEETARDNPSLQAQNPTTHYSRFSKLASLQHHEKGLRLQDSDTSVSSTISKDSTAGERARQASLLAHYGSKVNSKHQLSPRRSPFPTVSSK